MKPQHGATACGLDDKADLKRQELELPLNNHDTDSDREEYGAARSSRLLTVCDKSKDDQGGVGDMAL